MVALAKLCSSCKGSGIDPRPSDPPNATCFTCGGSKYELTPEGHELRKFLLALLGDDDVYGEVLKFVQLIKRDMNRPQA
jgi:hypothetical protein